MKLWGIRPRISGLVYRTQARLQDMENTYYRQQRKQEQDQEDCKQHLGNGAGDAGDTAKTEQAGDQRDNGEDDGPLQHGIPLWRMTAAAAAQIEGGILGPTP